MSRKSAPDRSMYAYDGSREMTWGLEQSVCPKCHQEGLYIAMEDLFDERSTQDKLVKIGWQPIYACDDCHLIFGGPQYRH